jgi:predicted flap endonuclease-1-like 5' DNA nuclease
MQRARRRLLAATAAAMGATRELVEGRGQASWKSQRQGKPACGILCSSVIRQKDRSGSLNTTQGDHDPVCRTRTVEEEAAMTVAIKDLQGATPDLVDQLKEKGITNNEQLLAAAAAPAQRKELASACGCDVRVILELANRADLARVKGVSGVYSDLLEKAGVDTVKELATRRADNLHARILATNDKEQVCKQPPALSMVESWVEQAKELPKTLSY